MGPPPRWVIGVLGALLSLGSPGCTETGVGPADDDGTPDDDATADNDTVADDDSTPDDDATPDDDGTADDDTVPDDDNTPDDDTTPDDDSSAVDDDTTPPLPCEVVPGPPDCGDPADADCDGSPDVEDCAPADPRIHPGTLEVCGDAVDDNCDGVAPPCRHQGEIELDVDDPTCADAIITASVPMSGLGHLAAFIGDVDGDGSGDLFVERFKTDANGCVIAGPLEGFIDVDVTPEACVATFGAESDVGSGLLEVDGAGDVNHDGYDDIVVSMNLFPWDADTLGAVMIFPGPVSGELVPEDALFAVMPEVGTDGDETRLSADVSVGDVDGDGEQDLLVVDGTHEAPTAGSAGAAVYLGPLSGLRTWDEADIFIVNHDDYNGVGTKGELTDVDGDGAHEVRVIGPSGEYLEWWGETLFGFKAPLLGDIDITTADARVICDEIEGPCLSDRIAWAAPTDNHGCGGMWLLAPLLNLPVGRGFPVYGTVAGEVLLSSWPYWIDGTTDWQAQWWPAVADINGDGWVDLALGDPYSNSFDNGGTAPVLLGPVGAPTTTGGAFVRYHGQGDSAIPQGAPAVGGVVDSMDVNSDGYGDLLIAAPGFFRTITDDCNPYWDEYPGVAGCYEGAVFVVDGGP